MIERYEADNLTREVWNFRLIDGTDVRLSEYRYETRKTLRHKWVKEQWYDFYNKRDSTIKVKPVVPDNIILEAIQYYKDQIHYTEWS